MRLLRSATFVLGLALYRLRTKMWFNPEVIQEALSRIPAVGATVDANAIANAEKRRKAEQKILKKILESGIGVCCYCGEEIYNNPRMYNAGWTWESEFMLGWCEESPSRKHQPKIEIEEEL